MTKINNISARGLAVNSLEAYEKSRKYSNLEVDSVLKRIGNNLNESDKALYTRLVYGVIERKLTLDHIIEQYSDRPVCKMDLRTACTVRLGIYQLTFMNRIPDYAAVSETVSNSPAKSRSFVNALLRSFIRQGKKYTLPPDDGSAESMSVRYSVSEDICSSLIASYGADTASVILSAADKEDPSRVCLRINTLKTTLTDAERLLLESGVDVSQSKSVPDILICGSFSSPVRKGVEDGLWFIQDEASRFSSLILGAEPGMLTADICAAPGGKTYSAALDMMNRGCIRSFDLHENKLSLIKRGASILGISIVSSQVRDGKNPDPALIGKCDRVICDVPCSGFGVLAKKPDIRYKTAEEFRRLPEIQYQLLCGGASYLKPGGVMIYSTCTLNIEENEKIAERFLIEHSEFEPYDFDSLSLGQVKNGMLTVMPQITGTDGFFAARLRRKERVS